MNPECDSGSIVKRVKHVLLRRFKSNPPYKELLEGKIDCDLRTIDFNRNNLKTQ
jgi:hypothetical protein